MPRSIYFRYVWEVLHRYIVCFSQLLQVAMLSCHAVAVAGYLLVSTMSALSV